MQVKVCARVSLVEDGAPKKYAFGARNSIRQPQTTQNAWENPIRQPPDNPDSLGNVCILTIGDDYEIKRIGKVQFF